MSDTVWLSINFYCSHSGIAFSFVTNCTLLALLCRRQATELGSYRYLMITFCLFSMFYSFVEWFMQPLIHIFDDTTMVIQQKRFDYSRVIARIISSTYCGCLATSFTLFAVHFIYRYLAVCHTKRLSYFEGYRFFLWLFGVLLTASSWAVFAFFCFPENERTESSFREVVRTAYNLSPETTAYVPYTMWVYRDGEQVLNPVNIVGLAQHCIVMGISFAIVFFCGYRTAVVMKKTKAMSRKTRALQRQLFNALVIQTIIPSLFMYIPTGALFLLPAIGVNANAYGNLAIVSIHLYPGIDPLVLILLINDFRRSVGTAFCTLLKWTIECE